LEGLKGLTKYREYLEASTIFTDILKHRRQYFINKVKAPLMSAMVAFTNGHGKSPIAWITTAIALVRIVIHVNRYPKPTRENTRKLKTHVLLDIWDDFFKYEHNKGRDPLFQAIRRIFIGEYEHDRYYADRIDWFVEKIVEKYQSGEWPPRRPGRPYTCWAEPYTVEARKALMQELLQDIGAVNSDCKERRRYGIIFGAEEEP